MTSLSAPQFSDSTTIICIFCLFLIPLTAVGLALLNTGLGRSRSAAHTMAASLCILAVGAVAYFVCGFAFQGFPGQASHVLRAGGKGWDWLAASPFFLRRLEWNGSPPSLTAAFGMLCAGLAGLISLGAAQERWRLGSICVSTALLAGWTFPLFAHWAWGGGWLAQLGRNYGLGQGFADVGGSGCIQVVGGLTALSVAWMVGPRRGKYSSRNLSNAIPAHNAVFVLFGGLLAWVGWLGLNSAGAMLFAKATPGQIVLVVINTTLAASSGGLAALAVTGVRFGRPDASLTANGWIGGLVASSAACVFFKPAEAVVVGAIAGILVTYSVEWLEFDLKLDDSGAAISAHAVGGIWGLIAAGLFASFPINLNAGSTASGSDSGQFLAQVVGIATLIGFILPMSYGLNWLLGRVVPQRARLDGEQQGMDLHELGTEAYPEFVVHSDEFSQR